MNVSFIIIFFRGYTGVYANGDGDKGVAECPFEFYHQWVTNPKAAQAMAEKVTRPTIGVKCCPVVRSKQYHPDLRILIYFLFDK